MHIWKIYRFREPVFPKWPVSDFAMGNRSIQNARETDEWRFMSQAMKVN